MEGKEKLAIPILHLVVVSLITIRIVLECNMLSNIYRHHTERVSALKQRQGNSHL